MPGATTSRAHPKQARRYRSGLRQQQTAQTRRAVVAAAGELFATKGWSATGMRDIAAAAGVALETVYAHFTSKSGVLRAVADAAVVGDDAPIPLAQRPEFEAIGRGRRRDRMVAAAQLLAAVHERTAPVLKVLREAAPADEEIAGVLRTARELQRRDVGTAVGMMVGRTPTKSERDGVWAIASPEVYLLLVDETGWKPRQYATWVAETFERVVPRR